MTRLALMLCSLTLAGILPAGAVDVPSGADQVTTITPDLEPTDELGHSRRPFNLSGIPADMRPMFAELDAAMKSVKKKYKYEDEHCGSCDEKAAKLQRAQSVPAGIGGIPANPENPQGPRLYAPSQSVTTFTISRSAQHESLDALTKGLAKLTEAGRTIASIQQVDLAENATLVIVVTTETRLTPFPTLADLEFQFTHSRPLSGAAPAGASPAAQKPWTGPAALPPQGAPPTPAAKR